MGSWGRRGPGKTWQQRERHVLIARQVLVKGRSLAWVCERYRERQATIRKWLERVLNSYTDRPARLLRAELGLPDPAPTPPATSQAELEAADRPLARRSTQRKKQRRRERKLHLRVAYSRLVLRHPTRAIAKRFNICTRTVQLWCKAALTYQDDEALVLQDLVALRDRRRAVGLDDD